MSLIVRPVEAHLTRDVETIGRMDPYCVITCGGQKKQTEPHTDGSKNPSWKASLPF